MDRNGFGYTIERIQFQSTMRSIFYSFTALVGVFFIHSCAGPSMPGGGVATYRAYDRPATLPTNPKNVKVKVSLSKQMVYVMEGEKPLLVMPVSIGAAGSETPKGNFTIYYKDADRRAQTHGFAILPNGKITSYSKKRSAPAGAKKVGTPMPYWTEFSPGYGFHTGWLKPRPCTHGCIRMHENVSPKFFRLVSTGTPLNISYSQAEDSTHGVGVKRPIDADPLPDYPISFRLSNEIFTHHKKPSFK
jgi:hypothetical protein